MSPALHAAYQDTLRAMRREYACGNYTQAFSLLERAHILGQHYVWPHVVAHAWMLRVGWQLRKPREVLGQTLRIVAAAVFSRLWVPEGNTGGSNVGALRPMPVPDDLRALLDADRRGRRPLWRSQG